MYALGPDLIALLQIIIIDIVLAGDNAIVVGLAASRIAPELRGSVIFWGTAMAVVLRLVFALVATHLLAIVGLTLAGGLLLLWVCWKMYREIIAGQKRQASGPPGGHNDQNAAEADPAASVTQPGVLSDKPALQRDPFHNASVRHSIVTVALADVSMSLDNVLAVAGAAKGNTTILLIGLVLSVVLMGWAASMIARLLVRHRWMTWIGLAVLLFVAVEMIWRGGIEVVTGKLITGS